MTAVRAFVAALVVGVCLLVGCGGGGGGAENSGFCDRHDCIPSFYEGSGSVVQCDDGMWSHSGGLQGACSHHGGEKGGW